MTAKAMRYCKDQTCKQLLDEHAFLNVLTHQLKGGHPAAAFEQQGWHQTQSSALALCVAADEASAAGSTPVGEALLAGSGRATDASIVVAGAASGSDGTGTPKAPADEELLPCEVVSSSFCLEPGLGPVQISRLVLVLVLQRDTTTFEQLLD